MPRGSGGLGVQGDCLRIFSRGVLVFPGSARNDGQFVEDGSVPKQPLLEITHDVLLQPQIGGRGNGEDSAAAWFGLERPRVAQ
jgi:hypothetical protein